MKHQYLTSFLCCFVFLSLASSAQVVPPPGDCIAARNYTKLVLSKELYDKLRLSAAQATGSGVTKNDVFIFQFAYQDASQPYPTLAVYYRHQQGSKISFTGPLMLSYFGIEKPHPDLTVCEPHVTGDLQISLDELEALKKETNAAMPENYKTFVFIPSIDGNSKHVVYSVGIDLDASGSLLSGKTLNPSPPYGAN